MTRYSQPQKEGQCGRGTKREEESSKEGLTEAGRPSHGGTQSLYSISLCK